MSLADVVRAADSPDGLLLRFREHNSTLASIAIAACAGNEDGAAVVAPQPLASAASEPLFDEESSGSAEAPAAVQLGGQADQSKARVDALTASTASASIAPMVEASAIAGEARALQASLAQKGHRLSAADAVQQVMQQRASHVPGSPEKGSPSAGEIQAFYDGVRVAWMTTPGLQKAYADFPAYLAGREVDYCRAHHIGLEQLKGDASPAETFIAQHALTEAATAQVLRAQSAWQASPELRREFVSFALYAAYALSSASR